jgi:hypothetical protein
MARKPRGILAVSVAFISVTPALRMRLESFVYFGPLRKTDESPRWHRGAVRRWRKFAWRRVKRLGLDRQSGPHELV